MSERFLVLFTIQDSVEVLVQSGASESEIEAAAREELRKLIAKARGCPFEVEINSCEGPY